MHSFKDTEGREWKLSLNTYTLKKVKDECGVLLTKIADDNSALLIQLHEDLELLVNILWCLCAHQAKGLSVVDDDDLQATEKFAMGLGGDALADAQRSLVDAICDFPQSPQERAALKELVQKARTAAGLVNEKALAHLMGQLEKIDPHLLAKNYIDSALSSPASPESTHGNTRSANSAACQKRRKRRGGTGRA